MRASRIDDDMLGCFFYLAVAAAAVLIGWPIEAYSCSARFAGSNDVVDTSWGPIKGCTVDVRGKGWVPAANYRVL